MLRGSTEAMESSVQIEFTNLPDAERDRRHLRMQIARQVRARRVVIVALAALFLLLGVLFVAADATALGIVFIVAAVMYPLLVPLSVQRSAARLARRASKLRGVPTTVVITDVDVTFTSVFSRISWTWAAIDTVTDLGEFLVARCGEVAVFTIQFASMTSEQVSELRRFLAARPSVGSDPVIGRGTDGGPPAASIRPATP